ncbi:MAG: hypothetical protein H7838_05025 [Magnetococcus sp. DMHC-8]
MLRVLLICCVAWVGGMSGVAHAFSLGELQLSSKPGQALQATAPIKLGRGEEIVSVAIGSAADYALLNLPHSVAVETLTVQVKEQAGGPVVWLQGSAPIQESDFFILLRVVSNQHTFFPFFRLHATPVGAGPERKKTDGREQDKGESKAPVVKTVDGKTVTGKPAAGQPPLDQSTVTLPVLDKPTADASGTDRSTVTLPVEDKPVADAAGTGRSTVVLPVEDKPVADTPATSLSTVDLPLLEQPAADPLTAGAREADEADLDDEPVVRSGKAGRAHDDVVGAMTDEQRALRSEPRAEPKRNNRVAARTEERQRATDAAGTGKGHTYGPVRDGENLTEVVQRLHLVKGENSYFQAMVALWKHNPDCFIRNNMNGLKAGVMLTVPTAQEIARIDAREARQVRLTHGMEWQKPSTGQQKMAAPMTAATSNLPVPATAAPGAPTAPDGPAAAPAAGPPPAKPTAAPGSENEELRAILTQLQVITRVLESNQAQQDRLEKRISSLEQARKEWDFLRDRISELEHVKEAVGPRAAAADPDAPWPAWLEQGEWLWLGGGLAGLVVCLGGVMLWLGRRWNQSDRWKSLQALLSDTARQDPQLLRDALKQGEPTFGREFVPTVHNQKLEGVAPSVQKRVIQGDVAEAASKLEAMASQKK